MSKYISQNTFDDVVQENIVDFSMNTNEAKEETIKQFEAQGINLACIITDLSINDETGKPLLNESITTLNAAIGESSTDFSQFLEELSIIDGECQKSIAHRILAGKLGAQGILLTIIERQLTDDDQPRNICVIEKCLKAGNSLTHKQPDIFDAETLNIITKLLKFKDHQNIICLSLQWLQKACVMHETNRQNIINCGFVTKVKPLLEKGTDCNIIKDTLTVFRYLVLDDDIRVEFGCAHKHARIIASEYIVDLTQMLKDYTDSNLLADILLTMGSLTVRQDFCTKIEEVGGVKLVLDIMVANPNCARLNREALKFLRALGGNDAVKIQIVRQGVAPIIKQLLTDHMSNDNIVTAALACISTLTLRVKDNSTAFFDTGIAEMIVETIRSHRDNKIVQRNGAWAIRNMVSRSRHQCEAWLSFGVEDLLNSAMNEHSSVEQDIKAALRDLGCHVHLKEEWTGTAEKKILN